MIHYTEYNIMMLLASLGRANRPRVVLTARLHLCLAYRSLVTLTHEPLTKNAYCCFQLRKRP
jgi:hypothetical protein